ncbi:MAG: ATPase, T2SS/T4P/T4SS family [Candidatus Omnitrophota bacterium]
MNKFDNDLASELIKRDLVLQDNIDQALVLSSQRNIGFSQALIEGRYIDEAVLLSIASEISGIGVVNLKELTIDNKAVEAVPVRFCWHYEFMPLKLDNKLLTIAVTVPLSVHVQDEIRLSLGFNISMFLSKRGDIIEALKTHYGLGSDTVDRMVGYKDKDPLGQKQTSGQEIEDIERIAEDASIVKLVNQIILDAYIKRATDIHIEPFRGKVRLRYRIDSVLFEQSVPRELNSFIQPILSRIKIMANLNIVEHRLPQDGRLVVKTQEQILDLRVSFMPTPHGESLVIRILPTKMVFSLEKLGFYSRDREFIESIIKRPNGIMFVTGPTGSGKTTTLYACLEKVNRKEKKVITVEDPMEYEMSDVTQIQVNPDIELTFAKGLRSILRHDPDIIMVGEVRDKETAEIAIRVALTGHFVLSTLHTNDAVSAITRLVDIGIEPYLVAASVHTFIAQRLIRVLCSDCKEEAKLDDKLKKRIIADLGLDKDDFPVVYKKRGCQKCNSTGFYGRTAIYEILNVDQEVRRMILDRASADDIKSYAVENGMRVLFKDGWSKVLAGVTTASEVLSVCDDTRLSSPRDGKSAAGTKGKALLDASQDQGGDDQPGGSNRRIFMRVPKRISIEIRLVDQGGGTVSEIISEDFDMDYVSVLTEELLESKITKKVDLVDSHVVYTTTLNLSAGGVVLESRYRFPLGSILDLRIYISEKEPLQCLAKVVRVEKDLPHCFHVALCFLDMSGVQRTELGQFIEKEAMNSAALNMDSYKERRDG